MDKDEKARLEALGYTFAGESRPTRNTVVVVKHNGRVIGRPNQTRAARAWYYALKMAREHSQGAIFRYWNKPPRYEILR